MLRAIRVVFASKNFISGQQVNFTIHDNLNNIVFNGLGSEWGSTGVYFLELSLRIRFNQFFLIIAEEVNGNWKSSKLLTKNDLL